MGLGGSSCGVVGLSGSIVVMRLDGSTMVVGNGGKKNKTFDVECIIK